MGEVELGGRTIAFDDVGDGPKAPVLLVHGASEHRGVWSPLAGRLASEHRVVAPDMPGHGASAGPAPVRVDAWGDVLLDLHTALGLGPCIVIGHSLGGAAVQVLYRLRPDAVTALGLVSTSANFGVPDDVIDHWLEDPSAYRRDEAEMNAAHLDSMTRKQLDEMRESNGDETIAGDLRAIAAWDNPEWRSIDVPLLILTATRDSLFDTAQVWRAAYPSATYVEVADAGHMMLVDHGDETAASIAAWIARLPPPGRSE
jgi:pimeloyl-ACP methyl ester carboxylesterase